MKIGTAAGNTLNRSKVVNLASTSVRLRPTPKAPTTAGRILVLDDDESTRFLHTLALTQEGFQVDTAADGEQGWDALAETDYDLVLTDHDMPRLTGLELVARMRCSGLGTPVIFISGSPELAEICAAGWLAVAAVLKKSSSLSEMVNAVKRMVPIHPETSAESGHHLSAWNSSRPSPPRTFLRTNNSSSFANKLTSHQNLLMNTLLPSPAMAAHPLDQFLPPAPHRTTTLKRILVADDDAMVRAALCAVLESEGYAVDEAQNGIEAVTRAVEHAPDLVLLDLNMPHLDGWQAFAQLERLTPLLPVIVITARPNQYKEAVRLGVDAFMEKPLSLPLLLRAMKRLTTEPPEKHLARITSRNFVTRLLDSATP